MTMRYSFTYDPARQGYNTTSFWKTLSGTPTTGDYLFVDTDTDYDIDAPYDSVTITESITMLNKMNSLFTQAVTVTENVALTIV